MIEAGWEAVDSFKIYYDADFRKQIRRGRLAKPIRFMIMLAKSNSSLVAVHCCGVSLKTNAKATMNDSYNNGKDKNGNHVL